MTEAPPRMSMIPTEHARSWLLISGSRPEKFTTDQQGDTDAAIFDLEDGVVPASKMQAREDVCRWLGQHGRGWVRVNNATTDDWATDLRAVGKLPGLDGVMLAKCESAQQIERTADRLPPGTPILALIESALGIEQAYAIACASSTHRLAFGSGDFRRDTGASDDPSSLSYARSRLVVASRAADIPAPIDGPTLPSGSTPLPTELDISKGLGMTGKLCMRPEDTSAVNRAFRPSSEDVNWASDVIAELGVNGERVRDGSDLPKLARARKIKRLADVYAES